MRGWDEGEGDRTVLITFPDLLIIVTVSVTFIIALCLSCRCYYQEYWPGRELLPLPSIAVSIRPTASGIKTPVLSCDIMQISCKKRTFCAYTGG